jgi:hypothetical protein
MSIGPGGIRLRPPGEPLPGLFSGFVGKGPVPVQFAQAVHGLHVPASPPEAAQSGPATGGPGPARQCQVDRGGLGHGPDMAARCRAGEPAKGRVQVLGHASAGAQAQAHAVAGLVVAAMSGRGVPPRGLGQVGRGGRSRHGVAGGGKQFGDPPLGLEIVPVGRPQIELQGLVRVRRRAQALFGHASQPPQGPGRSAPGRALEGGPGRGVVAPAKSFSPRPVSVRSPHTATNRAVADKARTVSQTMRSRRRRNRGGRGLPLSGPDMAFPRGNGAKGCSLGRRTFGGTGVWPGRKAGLRGGAAGRASRKTSYSPGSSLRNRAGGGKGGDQKKAM